MGLAKIEDQNELNQLFKTTIKRSTKKGKEFNSKYQDTLKKLQDNPCETTRSKTEKLKHELEALYDEKVEGIIIRSRARWHEHGEKTVNIS